MQSVRFFILSFALLPFLLVGADSNRASFEFDFSVSHELWEGDFTDYPENEEHFYDLEWGWKNLPYQLGSYTKGIYLSGNNHSDDLFMFIKRKLTGLQPSTLYEVTFDLTIATNVPPGLAGVGGSPGESVFYKVGASQSEPGKMLIDGFYYLSVDKGNQSQGGKYATVVGNLANPLVDPSDSNWALKTMSNRPGANVDQSTGIIVQTDESGSLWVFTGTDSAFESTSSYYITSISITVDPVQ